MFRGCTLFKAKGGGGGVGVIVSKSLKMGGGVTFFKAAAEVGGGVEKYLSLTA